MALRPLLALGSRRPRATRSLATPGKGGLEQALSGLGCCCPNCLPPSPRGIQAEGQRRFRCWEQGTRIKVEPVPPCVGTPDCASGGWTASRLTGVCIERAPRSSSEIRSVLLQLLIVGGNSKELRWRNKGFHWVPQASAPCLGGSEGRVGPWDEQSGYRTSATKATLYWSLGLRRFQGSGLFFRSQLWRRGQGAMAGA